MQKTYTAIAVASLISYTSFLQAQENKSDTETMVVTANRVAQSLSDVIASTDIVTKEEIEASQAVSFADVLKRLPGVQVITSGYGKATDVYIRGTASKHALVLINGVRVGSATLGSASFSQIPLTGIERVELIRGPRAALYGSDAIGGVINIVTNYQGEELRQLTAGIGSDAYYSGKLSAAGKLSESSWGKVALSYEENEGFSARKDPYESDNDGFEAKNIVAEVGTQLNEHWALSLQGYYHDGESEYDDQWGGSNAIAEISSYNVAAKTKYYRDTFSSELTIARNKDSSTDSTDESPGSEIKTNRTVLTWQNVQHVNQNLALAGGVDWYREEVSNEGGSYDEDSRDNTALFLTSIYQAEKLGAEASIRSDDNDSYGRENTWQLGLSYRFADSLAATVSGGTAFKAPTFNDLYYPGSGNPDLKPEDSRSIEASLYGDLELFSWSILGYKNSIDNLIDWAPIDDSGFIWQPSNIDKAEIKGVETLVSFNTGDFYHTVSYDYTNAKDDNTDKYLVRRAKHNAKWNLAYELQQWQFDVSTRYRGTSFEDEDNTQKLSAFTVVDFATTYYFSEDLKVGARIVNLFDEEYETKSSFNTEERSYYANVSYQF